MRNTSGMYLLRGIRQGNQILKVYKQNRPVYARRFFYNLLFFQWKKDSRRKSEKGKQIREHPDIKRRSQGHLRGAGGAALLARG